MLHISDKKNDAKYKINKSTERVQTPPRPKFNPGFKWRISGLIRIRIQISAGSLPLD